MILQGWLDKVHVSKKVVLTVSFLITGLFFYLYLGGNCSEYSFVCTSHSLHFSLAILWAPVLLFLSLLTLIVDKRVFDSWMRFTVFWLPLIFVAVMVTPIYVDGVNWEALISLSLTAIFFVVSLGILFVKTKQIYPRK